MKIIPVEQRSPEWHQMRKNKIGASMAPIIMGESPYKTPYGLWEEMLSLREPQIPNDAMRRGLELEDEARELFQKMTKLQVFPCVIQSDEYEWLIASLDGIDLSCTNLVEIKCGSNREHYDAIAGKIPDKYVGQLQHQMFVADVQEMFYFSYCMGTGAIVNVPRDEKYIEKMLEKEKEFWNCIQELREPEMTDRDYTHRDDIEWEMLASRWNVLNSHIKKLKAEEEDVRKSLIDCARGSNVKGCGLILSKIMRRGNIDYSSIEELKSVDLEQYRKPNIITHRIQSTEKESCNEYVHCIGCE